MSMSLVASLSFLRGRALSLGLPFKAASLLSNAPLGLGFSSIAF